MKNSVHLERLNSGLYVKVVDKKGILPLSGEEQLIVSGQCLEATLREKRNLQVCKSNLYPDCVDYYDSNGKFMGMVLLFSYPSLALYPISFNETLQLVQLEDGCVQVTWFDASKQQEFSVFGENLSRAFDTYAVERLEQAKLIRQFR